MTTRPHIYAKLNKRVTIRFADEDLCNAYEQADAAALPLAEFVRRRTLGKQIVPKTDLRILAELRRLGGLMKHIHLETNGAYAEDTRSAIQALESYTKTLQSEIINGTRSETSSPIEKTES